MADAKYNLKSLTHDPDYYAETFSVYAQRSAKYQVLATWADTVYTQKVIKKLFVAKDEQEVKLRILGVGSGTGGMDCKMIAQLVKKFPSISNTVLEPAPPHIEDYKKLMESKGFGSVECDWRQQTWDDFYNEYKQKDQVKKFHFISSIHSLYYVEDLETTILNLIDCLEEGGVLLMILISDASGYWRLWNRFPMFADELYRQINSGSVRSILDKNNIKYEAITQESRVDISSCYEEGSKEGVLLTDFLIQVVRLREFAPKSFVDEVLAYMGGTDCSVKEGSKLFLNNDWQAIVVSK